MRLRLTSRIPPTVSGRCECYIERLIRREAMRIHDFLESSRAVLIVNLEQPFKRI